MKKKLYLLFLSFVLIFCNCSDNKEDTDYDLIDNKIHTILTRYKTFEGEENLLNFKVTGAKTYVINSRDELVNLLGEKFIKKFDDYSNIDYENNSVIICISNLAYDNDIESLNFYTNKSFYPPQHILRIDYTKNDIVKGDFIIEIIGVVIDKIDGDQTIYLSNRY